MRKSWQAYALLAPFFALIAVFMYYPPVLGILRSFYEWAPGRELRFVGTENYLTYFSHPETPREFRNMLILILASLLTGTVVPFIMADLIFSVRSSVAKYIYRSLVTIPFLAPGVVVILLWKYIYDPQFGPINNILEAVGLSGLTRNWLGDPNTAIFAVVGVGFPWVATVGTLIYLGGLNQIPSSIYDAAKLDGCVGLRRVFAIDLPLVAGQTRLLMVLSTVAAATTFESVLVLTNGGPGFATSVPGLSMYKRAFSAQQFGLASAIGVLIFLVAISMTFIINRIVRARA
jgi:raffinose/stachyose/melibiose transport system permease protein